MKNIILIIIAFLVFTSSGLYCSENNPSSVPEVDLDSKLQLGFQSGVGLGFQTGGGDDLGRKIVPKFSYDFSFVLNYYFMKNVGFAFEVGYQQFHFKEKRPSFSDFSEYKIKYLFFSFSPVFKIKNFIFSFGMYYAIVSSASFTTASGTTDDTSVARKLDLGLSLKAGYSFKISDKLDLITALSLKYQLLPYNKDEDTSGRGLIVLLSIGLMFDI